MLKKITVLLFLSMIFTSVMSAQSPSAPAVATPSDTVKAGEIVNSLAASGRPLGERITMAASQLVGSGYDDYYTTDSIASLRLNLSEFTPMTFINTVMALAKASAATTRPGWRDVARLQREYSCRRGNDKGFASIMYHSSDWINDNIFRGNVKELTDKYSGVVSRTKSLDEMTRFRNRFAALADSATFEAVRMTEMGFRTHRVPTLKKETVTKREITEDMQEGDILVMVTNRDGFDCYDIGFTTLRDNGPHLIHLSPVSKTVVEEAETLDRYFKLMTKYFQGYRLIRIQP